MSLDNAILHAIFRHINQLAFTRRIEIVQNQPWALRSDTGGRLFYATKFIYVQDTDLPIYHWQVCQPPNVRMKYVFFASDQPLYVYFECFCGEIQQTHYLENVEYEKRFTPKYIAQHICRITLKN